MRATFATLIALASLVLGGCGNALPPPPPSSSPPPKAGPHGWLAYALPEAEGYAEIGNEPAVEGRGDQVSTAIVVYFLTPEMKGLASSVSDVRVTLNQGRSGSRLVALKPEAKSDDAAGASRFVSELGPYRIEDLRGDLSVKIAGKEIKTAIGGGH